MTRRGHEVTLLCGGPHGERPYRVVRSGGAYTQFLLAPWAFRRHVRDCDVLVEVFGRARFPRIGELRYLLTLAPRGFYWFQLVEGGEDD